MIFAYHGYPWLIHRLTYRRRNHDNLHVRGYKEEGTTTTPFDMVVLNDIDRFHLVIDVIDRVPSLGYRGGGPEASDARPAARSTARYIVEHGEDMPEVRDWRWRPRIPSLDPACPTALWATRDGATQDGATQDRAARARAALRCACWR